MLSDGYIMKFIILIPFFVYFGVSCNWGLIETGTMGAQWSGKTVRTMTVTCSSDWARSWKREPYVLNRRKGSVFRGVEYQGSCPVE